MQESLMIVQGFSWGRESAIDFLQSADGSCFYMYRKRGYECLCLLGKKLSHTCTIWKIKAIFSMWGGNTGDEHIKLCLTSRWKRNESSRYPNMIQAIILNRRSDRFSVLSDQQVCKTEKTKALGKMPVFGIVVSYTGACRQWRPVDRQGYEDWWYVAWHWRG